MQEVVAVAADEALGGSLGNPGSISFSLRSGSRPPLAKSLSSDLAGGLPAEVRGHLATGAIQATME